MKKHIFDWLLSLAVMVSLLALLSWLDWPPGG